MKIEQAQEDFAVNAQALQDQHKLESVVLIGHLIDGDQLETILAVSAKLWVLSGLPKLLREAADKIEKDVV